MVEKRLLSGSKTDAFSCKPSSCVRIAMVIGLLMLVAFGQKKTQTKLPPKGDVLERRVQGIDVEDYTTPGAFIASLNRANAPGGLARVLNCEKDISKQEWVPAGSSLRQVLDTIVRNDPQYRWHIEDGVVNLLPAIGEPSLLQTRISRFRVKKVSSGFDALSELLALDEVKKGMEDLRLKHGIALVVSGQSPHQKEFSVQRRNVTLREALNAIAQAQGRAVWEYIEIHCKERNEVIIRF